MNVIAPRTSSRRYTTDEAGDLSWQERGLCADDPDWNTELTQLDQKRICINCPVHKECLNWALVHAIDDPSVWGGYNGHQRRILRRRAIRAARAAGLAGAA